MARWCCTTGQPQPAVGPSLHPYVQERDVWERALSLPPLQREEVVPGGEALTTMELIFDPRNFESAERFQAMVETLEVQAAAGNGHRALELARLLDPNSIPGPDFPLPDGDVPISDERSSELYTRAFDLLTEEAAQNNGKSMAHLAWYYTFGYPPVLLDLAKAFEWTEKAFDAGYLPVVSELYLTYSDPQSKAFNPLKAERMEKILKQVIGHFNAIEEPTTG